MAKKGGRKKVGRAVRKTVSKPKARVMKPLRNPLKKTSRKPIKKLHNNPKKSTAKTTRNIIRNPKQKGKLQNKPAKKKAGNTKPLSQTARKPDSKKSFSPDSGIAKPPKPAYSLTAEMHHAKAPGWIFVLKILIVLDVISYSYSSFLMIADYPSLSMLYLIAIGYFCVLYVGVANRKEWAWHLGVYFTAIILVASIWLGAGLGIALTAMILFIIFFQRDFLNE